MSLSSSELSDPSIKAAYIEATKNGGPINAAGMNKILKAAEDKAVGKGGQTYESFINATEGADIERIKNRASLTAEARQVLNDFIAARKKKRDPSVVGQVSPAQAKQVAAVLKDMRYIGKIKFKDPVHKYTYYPEKFKLIAKQIEEGSIKVFSYTYPENDYFAGQARGLYYHAKNELHYRLQPDGKRMWSTIVHEATHAIQDRLFNTNMKVWDAEACAHLAQAVMMITAWGEETLFDRIANMKDAAKEIIEKGEVSQANFDKAIEAIKVAYPDNRWIKFGED